MACPAMANIDKDASTATCDNATIGTTTGPANLQADWTANTINLDWYDGNTKLTVGSTSATCTYDDGITLPSTPTVPTGYTFGGWKVRAAAATFDLSTLASSISTNGIWYASHGATNYCYYYNDNTGDEVDDDCSDSHTSPLSAKEWATNFSYGTVKGQAICSTQHPTTPWYQNNNTFTSDHFATTLTDQTGEQGAQYCWCKPTGFDVENDGTYTPVASSSWVFRRDLDLADDCADLCADYCAYYVAVYGDFRRAVFGVAGN